jgi:hypothetical protein
MSREPLAMGRKGQFEAIRQHLEQARKLLKGLDLPPGKRRILNEINDLRDSFEFIARELAPREPR